MPPRRTISIGELTEDQELFLDWLCFGEERIQGESQNEYVKRRLSVTPSAASHWKKNPTFRRIWDERMRDTHAAPDLLSEQLDVLQQIIKSDRSSGSEKIKAVETYWKLLGQNSPDRIEHIDTAATTKDMTDEELAEQLEKARAQLDVV